MREFTLRRPFAVFSDIHGNLPGLEAILADADERGIGEIFSLGDLVGYGPYPNEVALLVHERGIPSVMGNYDQGIGFATGDCGCVYKTDEQRREGAVSLRWTDAVVSDATRAYLRTLDDRIVLHTPAGDLLAVHGSPRRINEYLFEERPQRAMARMAENNPYRALLFGHTHIPYAREVPHGPERASTLFINVGSGGRPKDGDWRVCYAIIDPNALVEPARRAGLDASAASHAAVEFVRLPYDYERLSAAIARTDLITYFNAPPQPDGGQRSQSAERS